MIDLAEGERLSFQFVTWLHVTKLSEGHYGWVFFIINDHSAKFGGHWTCRGGDILFLICHVTSCDHEVRGSCDVMGKFPSLYGSTLPSLVVTCVVQEKKFCNIVPSASFRYKKKTKKRPWNTSNTWLKFAQVEGIFFQNKLRNTWTPTENRTFTATS